MHLQKKNIKETEEEKKPAAFQDSFYTLNDIRRLQQQAANASHGSDFNGPSFDKLSTTSSLTFCM